MPIEVKIPALGESISSGILSSWKVAEGSYVEIDQPIYELETDKITQEGLAEVAGVITFLSKEGDEVEIGASIAHIDDSAEKPAGDAAPTEEKEESPAPESEEAPTPDEPAEVIEEKDEPSTAPVATEAGTPPDPVPGHSPAVRKALVETGIDPSTLSGTGKDGRLTKADVLNAAKEQPSAPAPAAVPAAAKPTPVPSKQADGRSTRRPLSPIRRKIASRLVEAQQNAAILSTFNEVDLSAVMALRKRHQDSFVKQNGVKLGFMSFFVKAVVHGLQAVPGLNVRIEGSDLVENHYFDVGVAVGTEKGLVVPVLRDCEKLSFAEIEQGIVGYAEKARSGGITLEDMQGGCFTITNGGIYGSMLSTPILNPPQSGILGMHAIQERAVVRNGEIVIRPMMYLALSYDHRVVDGKQAVTFLIKIKEAIEEPARLALGI
ncbi:MAG: 2-oxoglutarate dehydrogenase complex dihydrolipoyllysine-residue succinyltransferase [Opitutae bacterium]|nr:2-oxoglutarate dehydrogenase complex dihydrolipoyllysine-residue succinyltransferase [Opitutae bacterium]